jgi:glucan phosphoethanolaminetransferase (alkaline phosphatase superfamily)
MLLWLLLAGWSLLCLFLIFYVPVRYESELKGTAFGVECLIVSFMVLWFLGALVLFIATTFTQKDEKLKPG